MTDARNAERRCTILLKGGYQVEHLDLTPIGQNAHSMATQIIKNGLKDRLEGYYGIEA